MIVFKGVVAMDHPPLFYDDFDDTGGPDGPLEEERVPSKKNPRLQPSPDFVHFDLDPLNSEWWPQDCILCDVG